MTVQIALAPDEEAKLRVRAAALGQDLQTFMRQGALEKADRPTLSELLAHPRGHASAGDHGGAGGRRD
jgi:hypothetical protein